MRPKLAPTSICFADIAMGVDEVRLESDVGLAALQDGARLTMIERKCCWATAVPMAPGEVGAARPNRPRSSTRPEWSDHAPA